MRRFFATSVSLSCLLLGLAMGCADGGNEQRALQEYFETTEAAVQEQRASLDELGDPDINEDAVLDAREKTVVLEYFATQRRTLETLREVLSETVPPPAVGAAHDDVLNSVTGVINFWQGLVPELEAIDSIEGLERFGTQFVESREAVAVFEEAMSACAELQTIATQHDIAVDLMCAQDG